MDRFAHGMVVRGPTLSFARATWTDSIHCRGNVVCATTFLAARAATVLMPSADLDDMVSTILVVLPAEA
jgi:hypothetical protein